MMLDHQETKGPVKDAAVCATPAPFRVCVHRGTQQIGGTCIELESAGARILLDLGLPLDADPTSDPCLLLPALSG